MRKLRGIRGDDNIFCPKFCQNLGQNFIKTTPFNLDLGNTFLISKIKFSNYRLRFSKNKKHCIILILKLRQIKMILEEIIIKVDII